ncbi:MAG: hypothetical protein KF861_22635 [Planctomycetaceae bacterium]|nr:hypothetical protein [Planctomycetaceae bacterium]
MTHFRLASLVLLLTFACTASAQAQYRGTSRIQNPVRQPTTSPYLNLLRGPNTGGGGMGFNYFMRVQPQLDYLQTSQRLSGQVNQLNRRQTALQRELDAQRTPTGHSTTFLDTRGYFPQ